jgi:sulfite reductase (NADPH) flavoprotein alpha-component
MWRRLHSSLGLFGLILVLALSISGAILSVFPIRDGWAALPADATMTVADLAGRLATQGVEIDGVKVAPSRAIIVDYTDASGIPQQGLADPSTGKIIGPAPTGGPIFEAVKTFHRSFMLGDKGRILSGIGAGLMALLSISGLWLMTSRMGGFRRLFDRPKGTLLARLHTVLTRATLLPFLLSSITGVYVVLTEFELIDATAVSSLAYPASAQDLPAVSPGQLAGLAAVPLHDLRSLQFPFPDDTTDVFTLRTAKGLTVIDQFTGAVLEQVPASWGETVYNWIYALHTGQGMAWLGALLGLAAALVPAIAGSGVAIWWARTRDSRIRVKNNAPAAKAEVVILVGSEGGSTWGFAKSLHGTLTEAGIAAHIAPMNSFAPRYAAARCVLFLTSTYGEGHAPESANRILSHLADQVDVPGWSYAVLGFGDRAFPKYCQFAKDLETALSDRGWPRLLPISLINRQSTQAFATWGTELAKALGRPITLTHEVAMPATRRMELIARREYGTEVQSPTVVLRFRSTQAPKRGRLSQLMRIFGTTHQFQPCDLLGIVPPGDTIPRYYSISSAASDTEVEICVRKQTGGKCSTFLHDLSIGAEIDAITRPNPDFTPPSQRRPVVMVAAGTGIAPFIGLIRSNARHQPIHLFWGGRTPTSDFLYEDVLCDALADHSLTTLTTAFSRIKGGGYVQDKLREDADRLVSLIRQGAAIMVCGGDAMAQAARAEFDAMLAPLGQSVLRLKQKGQYLEDIF